MAEPQQIVTSQETAHGVQDNTDVVSDGTRSLRTEAEETEWLERELTRVGLVLERLPRSMVSHGPMAQRVRELCETLADRRRDLQSVRDVRAENATLPERTARLVDRTVCDVQTRCARFVDGIWSQLHTQILPPMRAECRRLQSMAANIPSLWLTCPPRRVRVPVPTDYSMLNFFTVHLRRLDVEVLHKPREPEPEGDFATLAHQTEQLYFALVPNSFVPTPTAYVQSLLECLDEQAQHPDTPARVEACRSLLRTLPTGSASFPRLFKLLLTVGHDLRWRPEALTRMTQQLAFHVDLELQRVSTHLAAPEPQPYRLWRKATTHSIGYHGLARLLDELQHFSTQQRSMSTSDLQAWYDELCARVDVESKRMAERVTVAVAKTDAEANRKVPEEPPATPCWSTSTRDWTQLLTRAQQALHKGEALDCVVAWRKQLDPVVQGARRALALDAELEPCTQELCTLMSQLHTWRGVVDVCEKVLDVRLPLPTAWRYRLPSPQDPRDCASAEDVQGVCNLLADGFSIYTQCHA